MSVRLNKAGLWEVRVQHNGSRKRYGAYDREVVALAKERGVKSLLEFGDKVGDVVQDVLEDYTIPTYEPTNKWGVRRMVARFRAKSK